MSKTVLKQSILSHEERDPFVYLVIQAAAKFFKIDPEIIILGPSNEKFSKARFIIMYAINEVKPMALVDLSRNLNLKEHTGAMHGIRKIQEIMDRPANNRDVYFKTQQFIEMVKELADGWYLSPTKEYNLLLDEEAMMILDLENCHQFKSIENQL